MFSGSLHRRRRQERKCGAWLLCALLLILCVNARLASYQVNHRVLSLATTQSFVESSETARKLPKAAPPLFWESVAIAAFVVATRHAKEVAASSPKAFPFNGSDPERYLRPPPVH